MIAQRARSWAVVLAAGEGSRLQGLTRDSRGVVVPKQFCSLQGGPSLLQETIQRALAVAPLQRICTVVAVQHRRWWERTLSYFPEPNVVAQPHNRGTAHGILLPLLRICAQDPDAVVVFLPSDHYIGDEAAFASSLRHAASLATIDPRSIYVLGSEPEEADPELGYAGAALRREAHAGVCGHSAGAGRAVEHVRARRLGPRASDVVRAHFARHLGRDGTLERSRHREPVSEPADGGFLARHSARARRAAARAARAGLRLD